MKKITLFAIFLLSVCFSSLKAQSAQGCDGKRYLLDVFTESVVSTTAYGYTTFSGKPDTLLADIYQPKGDTAKKRPLIILAFGGGFIYGKRYDDYMIALCKVFNKKGYVCASIDYRIYDINLNGIPQDSASIAPTIVQAQQDMRAAVRFFKKDAATLNNYGIDTNNIIVGGLSAGAITAMNVGYISDTTSNIPAWLQKVITAQGGVEGKSGNPGYTSKVKGVISMSGGLYRKEFMNKNSVPFVAYHGTADATVPYASGFTGIYSLSMDGDKACVDYARTLNVPAEIVSVPGGGHSDIYDPAGKFAASLATWNTVEQTFLKQLVCGEKISLTTPVQEVGVDFKIILSPNPSQDFINLEIQNSGINSSNYVADVFDVSGKFLKKYTQIQPSNLQINKNDVGTGLFFVRVTDNSGGSLVKKIVFTN